MIAQSKGVNVSIARRFGGNVSADLSGAGVLFSSGSLSSSVNETQVVDVLSKQWTSNPFLWAVGGATTAGVVSVDVIDSESSTVVQVSDAGAPILVALTTGLSTDLSTFQCSYWDNNTLAWTASGTVVVSASVSGSSLVVICAAVHLTDFSAVSSLSSTRSQSPTALLNAGSVVGADDKKSVVAVVAVIVVLGVCFVSWLFTAAVDARKAEELTDLRRAHLLLYGEIQPASGKGALLHDISQAGRRKLRDFRDTLRVRVRFAVPTSFLCGT